MGTDTGAPLLRSQLLARGYSGAEVRRLRRRLVAVRPGAYVTPDDERLGRPEARHLLAVRAALAQVGAGAVVSHASAAVVHGIAVWDVALDRVHLTRPGRSGGRRSRHLQVHVLPLEPDEIVVVGGITVTSLARTITDLARVLPFEPAVVVADSGLYLGRNPKVGVGRADVAASLARYPRRHGGAAAGRVLGFATDLAESVGESRSRVAIAEAGLPVPALQVVLHSAEGSPLGRVDFWWEEQHVVGEFDGRVKYGRELRPGRDPVEVLYEEKCREDELRAEDLGMVRWGWVDLDRFAPVAQRLRDRYRPC